MRSWLVRIWASLLGLVQEPAVPTSRRDANRHRSRRDAHFRRAALLRLEPLEDRTAPATFLLKDIRPGASGSSPQQMVNVNGVIFFIANDGSTGYELWKSDGTSRRHGAGSGHPPGALTSASSLAISLT
jgi:ELWxxDGT repeat protein